MYADLFRALLNPRNERKHPLLSALLYEFCPASAYFWRAGLTPDEPRDPVWKALCDHATDDVMGNHLMRYELGDYFAQTADYILEVQELRVEKPIRAPETTQLYIQPSPSAEDRRKFGQAVQKHFGGWENLYAYIHTWAFLLGDWRLRSGVPNEMSFTFRQTPLVFKLPGLGGAVHWEAFAWWIKTQITLKVKIGLLIPNGAQDELRLWLMRTSQLDGDRAWTSAPEICLLNYQTGESQPAASLLSEQKIRESLFKLATLAESGPYPPLNLYRRQAACAACGFHNFCYGADEHPSEIAFRGLEDIPTWQNDAR